MAHDIEVLTKAKIEALKEGVTHYFPYESGDASTYVYVNDSWSDIAGEFGKWHGRDDFFTTLSGATGIQSLKEIKKASSILDSMERKAPESEAPEMVKAPEFEDTNSLQKAVRESQEIERANREEKIKASMEKAKHDVETEITRQKKLRDDIEGRKIYQKTKYDNEQKLADNQKEALTILKKASQENPRELANQIEKTIYNRLKSNISSGTSDSEIQLMSKRASVGLVKNLRGESLAEKIVIANQVSKSIEILHRAGISNTAALEIKMTAERVVAEGVLEYEFNRKVIMATFGQRMASNYGPKNLDKIQVLLSPAKFDGADSFDLSEISSNYSNSLQDQNVFLDGIKSFGENEIKNRLTSHLVALAEKELPEGFIKNAISNQVVQAALDVYGVGVGESIVWEGTTLFGRIAVGAGYGPTLGWIGTFTGIDFGVSGATTAVASEVVGESIATGAIYTTETIMTLGSAGASTIVGAEIGVVTGVIEGGVAAGITTGAIETAAVAAAPATGGISLVVGAAIGLVTAVVGPKVIGWVKDNIHKAKGVIIIGVGGLFGAGVMIAGGFGSAISGGLIGGGFGWIGSKFASGGMSGLRASANIGAKNIMNIGWAIGSTALAGIGGPILTILLVFPLVIALILFIINSGAYVVPPGVSSASSQNQYIDVTKTATPAGPFKNTDLPLKIKYNITIAAKRSALTNVKITDTCTVVTKEGQEPCQSPPIVAPNGTIAVGAPLTFSYEAIYNSTYTDALVLNTVKVTANVIEETALQTAEGSYSIIIGNPPTECFEFDKSWANQAAGKANVSKAILKMSAAKTYMATLCKGGKITLTYSTKNVKYGGEIINGGITLYRPGTYLSDLVTLYTLAHESGHIYAHRTSADEKFADDPKVKGEGYICTYPMGKTTNEDFAETIALYISKVAGSTQAGCMSNFRTQYPNHWSFARNSIFFESLGW